MTRPSPAAEPRYEPGASDMFGGESLIPNPDWVHLGRPTIGTNRTWIVFFCVTPLAVLVMITIS